MRPKPGSSEWSLVAFTVAAQAAVGTCLVRQVELWRAPRHADILDVVYPVSLVLLTCGAVAALTHLGRPCSARFAMANLRRSWLSREMISGGAFGFALLAQMIAPSRVTALVCVILGAVLVGAITKIYTLRTVPAWNTSATSVAFWGTTLVLGAGIVLVILTFAGASPSPLRYAIAAFVSFEIGYMHGCLGRLARGGGAGAESARIVRVDFRAVLVIRTLTAILAAVLLLTCVGRSNSSLHRSIVTISVALLALSEILGRALFYASHRRVGL